MNAKFISGDIWLQLSKAARSSRQNCSVAVAYFGKGASRMLQLPKGSKLVVDSSESAVKSGQTCPADLLKMTKLGVRVYSVSKLHAKVFVLGRVAFVGSTNVSRNSKRTLIEAAVRLTDIGAVKAAREFVAALCLHEQTPKQLKSLSRMYRSPRVAGGQKRKKSVKSSRRFELPRLLLAQLALGDWSEVDQSFHDKGKVTATKQREHPRGYEMDSFRWSGKCPFKRGDLAIQVIDEGSSRVMVDAPGNVILVRTRQNKSRKVSFVYVERPAVRSRQIKVIASRLGRGALKRLKRRGLIRDLEFRKELLKIWSN